MEDITSAENSVETSATTESETANANAEIANRCISRATELGRSIFEKYMFTAKYERSKEVYLAERVNPDNGRKSGVSSVWHYTSAMALAGVLAGVTTGDDAKYFGDLYAAAFDSLQYYAGTAPVTTYTGTPTLTMYAVHRAYEPGGANITGVEAVYDDQMWIVRDLVKAYDRTGEVRYLDEAVRLADICIGGWDYTKKSNGKDYGGIPWGPGYATKHICSNAPLISALVRIYEIKRDKGDENAEHYLDWAKKIFEFCLRFENDNGTFGDLVGSERKLVTEDGVKKYVTTSQSTTIDRSAYSYNTGTMISGAASLYRVTGEEEYKQNAVKWAKGAYNRFTKTVGGKREYTSTSTLWFNLILLEGYLDLAPYESSCERYIETFLTSLDFAYENSLKNGLLPRDWLKGWDMSDGNDKETSIMDQAAAAEIYALLGIYYGR
jgi:hypothetical protein